MIIEMWKNNSNKIMSKNIWVIRIKMSNLNL